ncbi:MAG: hypothetical protein PHG18_03720 [Bacilli bacterium]|jgi:hypothetical protein|nr:hypothetical protein [Bacilli bacterium]
MIKNWKTTLAGVLTVILAGLAAVYPKIFTPELVAIIVSILAGFGFIVAKDNNVTGK